MKGYEIKAGAGKAVDVFKCVECNKITSGLDLGSFTTYPLRKPIHYEFTCIRCKPRGRSEKKENQREATT